MAPGTDFVEDHFSMDWGRGDGVEMTLMGSSQP